MPKVLVVGGSGLIGKGIAEELKRLKHEIVIVSRTNEDIQVDLSDHESIEKMYQNTSAIDAVISVPGSGAKMATVSELSRQNFIEGLQVKCLGQIDLVLTGQKHLNSGESFTLTTGILSTEFPLQDASLAYIRSLEGIINGRILKVW